VLVFNAQLPVNESQKYECTSESLAYVLVASA
jgi:hypothetical protein